MCRVSVAASGPEMGRPDQTPVPPARVELVPWGSCPAKGHPSQHPPRPHGALCLRLAMGAGGGGSPGGVTLQPRGDLLTGRMQGTLEVAEGQNETGFLPFSSCTPWLVLCRNYVFSAVKKKKKN